VRASDVSASCSTKREAGLRTSCTLAGAPAAAIARSSPSARASSEPPPACPAATGARSGLWRWSTTIAGGASSGERNTRRQALG
jgi:hypothetical protein